MEMIQHKPIHLQLLPDFSRCFYICRNMTTPSGTSPAKDMVLANCLSHFPSYSNYLPIPIAHNIQHVQLSNAELDNIWGLVECDPVYSTIYHITLKWMAQTLNRKFSHIARHFWGARDKLSINSGLLLKGTRVCIPPIGPQLYPCWSAWGSSGYQ